MKAVLKTVASVPLSPRQAEVLATIAECGGMGAAARKLGVGLSYVRAVARKERIRRAAEA